MTKRFDSNYFNSKVSNPDENGCMMWLGCSTRKNVGYGVLVDANGQQVKAHRHSYTINFGEIPNGMCVLHKCDNSMCVAPNHLFLGTQRDNMRDALLKCRLKISRLTFVDVKKIRELLENGAKNIDLASKFSVSKRTISSIKNNHTWREKMGEHL